jgi:hypothetical protein
MTCRRDHRLSLRMLPADPVLGAAGTGINSVSEGIGGRLLSATFLAIAPARGRAMFAVDDLTAGLTVKSQRELLGNSVPVRTDPPCRDNAAIADFHPAAAERPVVGESAICNMN